MSQVLFFHLLMALVSILLLWLRAALAFHTKWEWANHKLLLLSSAGSSALLLLSALVLMFWHDQFIFAESWVTEKFIWLTLYIILGVLALLPKIPVGIRALCLSLASMFFVLAFVLGKFKLPLLLVG